MYAADLTHHNQTLEDKLHKLYALNRHKAIDLSFRPPYLKLLELFGNPEKALPPVIHVAGTNGKGSIIATLRSALEAQGYKVHAYTSPHLRNFNERIYLAGEQINDKALEALIDEALELNSGAETTFFEITTAMALTVFTRTPADVALIEVGLGGRLDCTNVIPNPTLTIINTIAYDHTEHLGDTLLDIAKEKAGIMKKNVPCIIGPQTKEAIDEDVVDMFKERAQELNVPTYVFDEDWAIEGHGSEMHLHFGTDEYTLPHPSLKGEHQIYNAGTALAGLLSIQKELLVSKKNMSKSLNRIEWHGRLENIQTGSHLPGFDIWFDGGHNESAAATLAAQLQKWQSQDQKKTHLVFGMKADKNPHTFLSHLLPHINGLSLVQIPGVGGCVQAEDIQSLNIQNMSAYESVPQALQNLKEPVRVLICGSLYLAEQIQF